MDIINNNKTIAPFYRYNKSHKPTELVPNFVVEPKFRKLLTNKGYVLIARAAPNFDKLKKKIPGSQTTYLSMWQGYMQPGPAANTALQKSIVGPYLYKHVSGHCRITDLKNVIAVLHPNIIIPMHTDDPEQVRVELGEKVQVLQDGEELPLTNGQQ
jgi:ribonuclease J